MKKIVFTAIIMSLMLVGCGNNANPNTPASIESLTVQEGQSNKKANEYPTLIKMVSAEVSVPIGDRTVDNVLKENGDYFAIGSGPMKCSDYDNIHVVAELTNTRDTALTISLFGWSAKMEDGSAVEIDYTVNKDTQVEAGATATVEFDILKEKSQKGDKITLTYWDVDFGEEWIALMTEAVNGTSEEECKAKYPTYFDESLKHNIDIILK